MNIFIFLHLIKKLYIDREREREPFQWINFTYIYL